MLSSATVQRLNVQINLEAYSSNLYLQMSAWCLQKGLEGSASFLARHAGEETTHMHRLFNYVNETGALAVLDKIAAPPKDYTSIGEVFQATYDHELLVTKRINELVETALSEKDYSTFSFLQWYVAEQHEEEKLFKSILDKLSIIGAEGRGLFLFDREMGKLAEARAASS